MSLKAELEKLVALLRDGYDGAVKARDQDAMYRIGDAINIARGCLYSASHADQAAPTEAQRQAIIAAFLERAGQYVTNDATRNAVLAQAWEDGYAAGDKNCAEVVHTGTARLIPNPYFDPTPLPGISI